MITARQFRSGFIVIMDKVLYQVVEAQHIKPGKGGAFVRAKLKNLQSGSIAEQTFRPDDSFPQAFIEEKKMQFLYKDQSSYHFMDTNSFEQVALHKDILGDSTMFLKDGMVISASLYKHDIVGVSLPPFVELKITYTEPGIKGDTAKGGSKPATLETGAVIKVPLFINTDETIRVDTRTGQYAGRVS